MCFICCDALFYFGTPMPLLNNRITKLFNVNYPIVQAGMVWTSGWKLASAVSNAGALGLIGSGSMYPDVLKLHIKQCKTATERPFGVNIPLLYPDIDKHIRIVLDEEIKIVFTSAGNPKTWTPVLKQHGIKVVHVVSSSTFARKAEDAGCDAVVAEGFEAGGHNGREETTTMILIPAVREAVKIPVLAAGGIATGRQMFAAMALGADGVQMGSRFVCSNESSNHIAYKQLLVNSKEGDTMLSMKKIVPVRLFKNKFFEMISEAESKGAAKEELAKILGHGRAKRGMLEGDLDEGELEIGEVSALIKDIKPAADIVKEIWNDFNNAIGDPFN